MIKIVLLMVLAAAVGAVVAYLLGHGRIAAMKIREEMLQEESGRMRQEIDERRKNMKSLVDERAMLMARRDVLQTRVDDLVRQVDDLLANSERQKEEIRRQFEKQIETLRTDREYQVESLRKQYQQQLETLRLQQTEQMEQQAVLIREQMNTASEEILKRRSEELATSNKDQLAAILSPLQEHLRQMREAVERSDREHTNSMERLDASIQANLQQAKEVGERADKLAQALTAENKTQGNFGELRLKTLLESMGFEKGVQFEEQTTMRDERGNVIHEEEGRRMIPDVILHFPDKRDVVIDSKMSMKAFEEYHHSEDDQERQMALKRHLISVRSHVKELAHKNYSQYGHLGRQKPDFVIMYVYNESALQLALSNDTTLYQEAYEQGVIISGSQNMYMLLRVLEMTWRQVRQAENQEEIMKTADELVARVQLFYERFLAVDEQLKHTQAAFDKLKSNTAPTGKGIVAAANRLLHYGASQNPKRKQKLPKAENIPPADNENLISTMQNDDF